MTSNLSFLGLLKLLICFYQHLLLHHTISKYLLMGCLVTLFICELLQTVVDNSGTETETNKADWSFPLQIREEKQIY